MELVRGGFAMSALAFCFWVDGRSPKLSPSNNPRSLRIKFEEVIDHATARHNARGKIVREDSDGRRLIIELEDIVVHACWDVAKLSRELVELASLSRADCGGYLTQNQKDRGDRRLKAPGKMVSDNLGRWLSDNLTHFM